MKRKSRSLEDVFKLVSAGNVHAFYVTREWKDLRQQVLERDAYCCQRCLGKYHENKERIKLTKAKYVHHIIPMKESYVLALEESNLISLCYRCHEIVEGRARAFHIAKPKLTDEKW